MNDNKQIRKKSQLHKSERAKYGFSDVSRDAGSENRQLLFSLHPDENVSANICRINNKRYLGSKHKLLDFIREVVDNECNDVNVFADIFAGTGAVSSAFLDKQLIVNDLLYSNYICHLAWFSAQKYSKDKIEKRIKYYNNAKVDADNYMSLNFSDTYFDKETCRKIGFIREDIETLYKEKRLNERERALLITSLLYSIDKIANTCGHYDAYLRNGKFDKKLEMLLPVPETELLENKVFNMDANSLVREIKADLVYIDPPYNSRQYCDAYHLLENVAKWEKPEVFGVARKMDRTDLKSRYCSKSAAAALQDLVKNIKARYILLSYNNMMSKGHDRSNARIKDSDITRILEAKGDVKVFSKSYKAFSAGKSDIQNHEERLFLCICREETRHNIQSPLNYTGGKFKLLQQILPKFPQKISTFVDLFCGGCNVGVNVNADRVLFNDSDRRLIELLSTLKKLGKESVLQTVHKIIGEYGLSESSKFGYEYYSCSSDVGLQKYNKESYRRLKEAYNAGRDGSDYYNIMLYVLIVYAFNNQIRFNKSGFFNLPVGKRDFNAKMGMKLSLFIDRLNEINCRFLCLDFKDFPMEDMDSDSLVYVDPPYLVGCATYNERNIWNETKEAELLEFLDRLSAKGIRFALSNLLSGKGKQNYILKNWISENKYKVFSLNASYANSNYHTKDKTSKSDEVLVVNY